MKLSIPLKRALIFDKKITRDELILQTIYNDSKNIILNLK